MTFAIHTEPLTDGPPLPVSVEPVYCGKCGKKLRATNIDPYRWMGRPICDPCHHALEAEKERKLYDMWEDIPEPVRKRKKIERPRGIPGPVPHVLQETLDVIAANEPIAAQRLADLMGVKRLAMGERLQRLRREGKVECIKMPGLPSQHAAFWQIKEG